MKILLLFWGGGEGGDASALIELARALMAQSVDFALVAHATAHPEIFREKAEASRLEPGKNLFFTNDVADLWSETGLIRKEFDLIHVHHGRTVPKRTDIVPLRSMAGGLPIILTAHGPMPLSSITYGGLKSKISRFLSPTWFDAIVVPSEAKLREWRKMTPLSKNVFVIPNIVKFFEPQDKRAARKSFGLPGSAEIALFCSRLDEEKDPFTFISAVHAAAESRPNLIGIMAGNGALSKQCEALIAELEAPVQTLGYVTNTELLYAAADVFVQPSLFESFCITLLQAAALGMPCVMTDIEVFRNFYNGFDHIGWFNATDIHGCAEAMVRALVGKPHLVVQEVLKERFSEGHVLDAHRELWKRVLSKRRR